LAPIESLTLASKRLAQGDFSARAAETAAAPEFRALTATFNRMAEVLQLRERELRAANAAIKAKESDLEAANARLRDIALVDALTGLANRRRFDEALNKIWDDARSSGEPVALLIVDVDHFKMFNDRYGHPAGDRCLRQVAEAIRTGCSRPGDLAARIGGEEFALLLPALPREQLKATAELVRTSVLDREIVREDTADGQVSVSVGVAYFYASGGWSADRLRIAADKALYQAKREGRNRVVIEADEAPTSALFRQAS
jgi:diguanylate cyclase (GGDEF)-like protein